MKKACNIMNEKAGLNDIHEMKEENIRDEMLQDENMLKGQNVELTRYINTLEADRLKLTKKLCHNEYQMGVSGIRFLGLLAYHIIKVTEFAPVLRGDYI